MRVLFLHGLGSKPGGVKPRFLARRGHEVINPGMPDDDFGESVRIAQAAFDRDRPDVVVGSSRGGAVAMNLNAADAPIVLIAPAWRKWGSARSVPPGTLILHSPDDAVIPFDESKELAADGASTLIAVGLDHFMTDEDALGALADALDRLAGIP